MNKSEAISLATAEVHRHPISKKIDFSKITARFVIGAQASAQMRAEFPKMDHGSDLRDYWEISLPFWEEDELQRTSLPMTVDPITKQARILGD